MNRVRVVLAAWCLGWSCFAGAQSFPAKTLRIVVPADASRERVLFDFTGTGPQVRGNINSTITATQAGVLYALKALLDPEVPNNQGLDRKSTRLNSSH